MRTQTRIFLLIKLLKIIIINSLFKVGVGGGFSLSNANHNYYLIHHNI